MKIEGEDGKTASSSSAFCTFNVGNDTCLRKNDYLCAQENDMYMQRVPIPNVRQDERIGSSFNHIIQVVDLTERTDDNTVVWDFSGVSFMHPFFLAPLAIYRQQSAKEIRCENILLEMQSYLNNIYFDRMLHFENAPKEAAEHVMEHYAERSYTPLCSFAMNDENKDAFSSIVRNIIVRQARVGTAVTTPLSYFLSELVDNIYEHSGSPDGFLFSQYLEREGCIDLCIADNGISTSRRMLVEGLGGSFFMLSGSAFHRYERHGLNYYANVSRFFHWPGTIILLRIPVVAPQGFSYIDYLE